LNIGRRDAPNQVLLKDPALLDESIRHYAALPGGHNEAWPDAFRNLMRNILTFIAEGRDPLTADGVAFPTFADGLRTACIVEAIMQSSGRWTKVRKI
jgi:predicted dehydrogenase